jgi:hypothetical protein
MSSAVESSYIFVLNKAKLPLLAQKGKFRRHEEFSVCGHQKVGLRRLGFDLQHKLELRQGTWLR